MRRLGEDWYANKDVGRFLRDQLFSAGTSLSPSASSRKRTR
jgi:hypothetical protein